MDDKSKQAEMVSADSYRTMFDVLYDKIRRLEDEIAELKEGGGDGPE